MCDEPNVPKGEHGWVGYYDKKGTLLFLITSKTNNRDTYFLYENQDGKFIKLGKGDDPSKLCEKHNVYGRMKDKS